jgi:hypothetical protein
MPALNFKARFAEMIERGEKRCTIRVPRRRAIRAGDTLYLYTGMRTKACRKLKTAICRAARPIRLSRAAGREALRILVDGKILNLAEIKKLVRLDGHPTARDFLVFFEETHGLPFAGQLIEW